MWKDLPEEEENNQAQHEKELQDQLKTCPETLNTLNFFYEAVKEK